MSELFANPATPGLVSPLTTLGAAIATTGVTTITTSGAAPAALQTAASQFRILIDSEIMTVTGGASTTTWTVTRGAESSTAATHSNGANIYHILTAGALRGLLQTANNLSEVTASTARTNLGLGTAATQASTAFDAAGLAAAEQARALIAEARLAPIANPTFTGTVNVPTPALSDNSTKAANTAWVLQVATGVISVYSFGAKGGGKNFPTGAVVSGTSFTDSTNAPFVSGDTGKTIIIYGAGTATTGGNVPFVGTITYVSSNQVTLSGVPTNTAGLSSYTYGWDDTAALQAAINGSTGLLDWPNDTFLVSSLVPKQGQTVRGYGTHLWKIPGIHAIFSGIAFTDGVTLQKVFRCFGIDFHGEGLNGYFGTGAGFNANGHAAFIMNQWQDVVIKDCLFDGFPDSCIFFDDSSRVWFLDNRITNQGCTLGRNAIVFSDSNTGNPVNVPVTDLICVGNHIETHQAGVVSTISAQTAVTPLRLIIANNRIHMFADAQFTCIGLELATQLGSGLENARVIVIANNICSSVSTLSSNCISVHDAGAEADVNKIQDILIIGNECSTSGPSGSSGVINAGGSYMMIANNIIRHTGTGRGILTSPNPITLGSVYVNVLNNHVTMAGANTQSAIDVTNTSSSRFNGNIIVYSGGTPTAGSHGINISAFSGGTCSFVEVVGNRIDNASSNGIILQGAGGDWIVTDNKIYNPNAIGTATDSLGSGIAMTTATPSGTLNLVDRNVIIDNRGTVNMRYGIYSAATGGTKPTLGLQNQIIGTAHAALVGTTLATNFTPDPNGQGGGIVHTTVSYAMKLTDLGVVVTGGSGVTITLPTGATYRDAPKSWLIKNNSSSSVTVTNGGTNFIDGALTTTIAGGVHAANGFALDLNLLDFVIS